MIYVFIIFLLCLTASWKFELTTAAVVHDGTHYKNLLQPPFTLSVFDSQMFDYHFNTRTLMRQRRRAVESKQQRPHFHLIPTNFYSVQYYCRWQSCHLDMTTSPAFQPTHTDPHTRSNPLLSSVCFHRKPECVGLGCLCGDLLADWPPSLSAMCFS